MRVDVLRVKLVKVAIIHEDIRTCIRRDICAVIREDMMLLVKIFTQMFLEIFVCEDIRDDTGGDICHWLFDLSLVLMKRKSAKRKSHFYILDYYEQLDKQIFIYKLSFI